MARGRVDYRQLQRIQKNMQKLADTDFDKFCRDMAKELAARMLSRVVRRTPVGQYTDGTVGGTLRRGWTVGEIKKVGSTYEIEVINPTEYAVYVEFGHRTINHRGWVPGRFMMTISAQEVEELAPNLIERKLYNLLKGAFEND